jgi:hypothetical protein
MRNIVWWGTLGITICAAMVYLAAAYVDRHPDSLLPRGWGMEPKGAAEGSPIDRTWTLGLKDVDDVCALLLPDPAKLTADSQPFETIDLLSFQETSNLAQQQDGRKQPPYGFGPEGPSFAALVPAGAIRCADEAECLRLMPSSQPIAPLPVMPHARDSVWPVPSSSDTGEDAEEQQDELARPMTEPKAIEEQLKRILQSYLQERKVPGQAGVDTMEFRPSDAKKGEFDRIPF